MDEGLIINELDFKAVRSSGPGGQHANKTATKVELRFDVESSEALEDQEKKRIQKKLGSRINKEGILKMSSEDTRSQHTNREIVIQSFLYEIKQALKKPKPRKKTRPTKASKIKRLKEKRKRAEIKSSRKDPLK